MLVGEGVCHSEQSARVGLKGEEESGFLAGQVARTWERPSEVAPGCSDRVALAVWQAEPGCRWSRLGCLRMAPAECRVDCSLAVRAV